MDHSWDTDAASVFDSATQHLSFCGGLALLIAGASILIAFAIVLAHLMRSGRARPSSRLATGIVGVSAFAAIVGLSLLLRTPFTQSGTVSGQETTPHIHPEDIASDSHMHLADAALGEVLSASTSAAPAPAIVVVEGDDGVATVRWEDQRYSTTQGDIPKGIVGYVVEWGKQSTGITNKITTSRRIEQIQPLENGVPYIVQVRSLDTYGNVSTPTARLTVTPNTTRVQDMRSRLTGFFDDFNTPMGPFDELKWNFATSACVSPRQGGQFVNSQNHAHNTIQTVANDCDKGSVVSRPRTMFDFTGRTGIVEFDMDGVRNRHHWYLDFFPAYAETDPPRDIVGHANNATSDPPHMLRIDQQDNVVKILVFDAAGVAKAATMTTGLCSGDVRYCPHNGKVVDVSPIANVRRKWRIEVSRTEARVFIDGVKVAHGTFSLPYERAWLQNTLFSYNTRKAGYENYMYHWDNFGFDAPAGVSANIRTHNYIDGTIGSKPSYLSYVQRATLITPVKKVVKIPDPVKDRNGAWPRKARLMFTLQSGNYTKYVWTDKDRVILNGNTYPLPKPTSRASTLTATLGQTYEPHSVVMEVKPEDLVTGFNELSLYLNEGGITNLHIELDYPTAAAPAYTKPASMYSDLNAQIMPVVPEHGPQAQIDKISGIPVYGNSTLYTPAGSHRYLQYNKTLSGSVTFMVKANDDRARVANGKHVGIKGYQVLVDKQIRISRKTNTAVAVPMVLDNAKIDTTTLCNGVHEIFVRAYNANGRPSMPNYGYEAKENEYFPIRVTVSNAGQPSCSALDHLPAGAPPEDPDLSSTAGITPTSAPTPTVAPLSDAQILNDLIRDEKVSMITVMKADGSLAAHAVPFPAQTTSGELWYLAAGDDSVAEDVRTRPRVGVTFANPVTSTYVAISGSAEIVEDTTRTMALWNTSLSSWFPQGLNTPGLVLIKVTPIRAEYREGNMTSPVVLDFNP